MRNNRKRKALFRYFKQHKLDIICIQESYVTNDVVETWRKEWGGEIVYHEGTNHSKGQLILIKKHIPYKCSVIKMTPRIIAIQLNDETKETVILNVYAPNTSTEVRQFFSDLTDIVNEIDVQRKIVCGDFNCVLDNDIDVISGEPHQVCLVEGFNNFVVNADLTDSWRMLNPNRKEYSWSRRRDNTLVARRLDYVFVSETVLSDLIECSMHSFSFSDHRGILIQFDGYEQKRGPSYWKFNNSLLKDITFVNKTNTIIADFISENSETRADLKWELLKLKIKEEAIQHSKALAVRKRNDAPFIQSELNRLDSELAKYPQDKQLQKQRETICMKLEILERDKAQSAQTRARIKWIDEGERNTKYFLSLEKSKANAKIFPNLRIENKTLTNQFEILKAQKDYFENIYDTQHEVVGEENMDSFLQNCEVPQLSPEQQADCEGLITIPEASLALKSMKNGSSPGLDGLSTEFLKVFWSKIDNIVIDSFNFAFSAGTLSHSQRSATITLIHKGKELPKSDLQNWRPISITNSDYKLLAKCLAARLGKVVSTIISEDQVGYIKGRNISTLIRSIDDVIDYLRVTEKPGIILALDFQKAFDTISKDYLLLAFKRFGFGDTYIKWVQTVLTNSISYIQYNGWLSEQFNVKCGVRQGCPFSPLAFIIGIELLAIKCRQSINIKGINIEDQAHSHALTKMIKILMYADDITLLLKDKSDVSKVLKILGNFAKISGLVINKTKSQAMWIGSDRFKTDGGLGLQWVKSIKILGIFFSSLCSASEIEKNWVSRVNVIRQLINSWEKRNLGLLGKICVIKAFLLSQFIFVMQSISVPEKVIHDMNTLLFRFLWRKRDCNRKAFEKVKRCVVTSTIDKGGLNMIDLKLVQQSFLCEWLQKLASSPHSSKWSWIPKLYFSNFGRNMACFNSTIGASKFKGLENITSLFWKNVAVSWLNHNNEHTAPNVRVECLWNNSSIKHQNNVIFFKHWAKQGITYVNDMLNGNRILTFNELKQVLDNTPSLYLEYMVVHSAIFSLLSKYTLFNFEFSEQTDLLFNDHKITKAKSFRTLMTEKRHSTPCAVGFWNRKYNISIEKQHWSLTSKCTKESRIRELQWKILHNIYPTNILLLKIGIANDNKCNYCRNEIDFIEHFFVHCKQISAIWTKVKDVFYSTYHKQIDINEINILFGVLNNVFLSADEQCFLNHLMLIAKMCISKYKYGTPLDILIIFERELCLRGLLKH